jgi:hypothetical protein
VQETRLTAPGACRLSVFSMQCMHDGVCGPGTRVPRHAAQHALSAKASSGRGTRKRWTTAMLWSHEHDIVFVTSNMTMSMSMSMYVKHMT